MKDSGRQVSLFLVELIVDLALFVLCAAVCVGLLVKARGMSRESAQLTEAVYIAQTAAERWRAGLPACAGYFADGTPDCLDLDPMLKSTLPDYTVAVAEEDGMARFEVYPYLPAEGQEPIYVLTAAGEVAP